ncbi:ParB/RepB/Spo0J family partition protein (plasmid) [Phormidium sp. CLA17]|uniref:ParB/RepB/Spo0J family partition protein n=1 Tax=Leptolyngbya sp. Cla-17 TaxID=2803751 RepID=UPI001492968C|nr:ParB/RepB/Spo0J family partition protein [Leptolyngbya sp. Cla-17]MBM0745246.1 ParB/RepB/Spo0J family partition protein [Leptolyngbya sp. Cla-17]
MSLNDLIKTAQSNTKRGIAAPNNNAVMSLEAIKPRDADTRPLNSAHVEALAESIAALGLIEPLAVDKQGRLLAGGHRLAAISQLKEIDLETFNQHFAAGVPVRVMEFDAQREPSRALEVEIAENEQRRDYTPAEVRAIADRLRKAGYKDGKGRPKAGEKALAPALQTIIGKSRRTVMSYLAGEEPPKNVQSCTFIKKALKELEQWEVAAPDSPGAQTLIKQLPKFKQLLRDAISESIKPN